MLRKCFVVLGGFQLIRTPSPWKHPRSQEGRLTEMNENDSLGNWLYWSLARAHKLSHKCRSQELPKVTWTFPTSFTSILRTSHHQYNFKPKKGFETSSYIRMHFLIPWNSSVCHHFISKRPRLMSLMLSLRTT